MHPLPITYSTESEFISRYGEDIAVRLTNLYDAGSQVIDSANLARHRVDAKALIDGYISSCPGVAAAMPFDSPPPLLTQIEMVLIRYSMDHLSPSEDVTARYQEAIRQLQAIGRCELSLGLIPAQPAPGVVRFRSPGPVFTRDTLRGWSQL